MTSIREQLILADIDILNALSFVQKVDRSMADYDSLRKYTIKQLPVVSVVGRLPSNDEYKMSRRDQEIVDYVLNDLIVDIYFYFQSPVTSINNQIDSQVSSYANDLYVALFADPSRGGLCLNSFVSFTPEYMVWTPFVAFKLMVTHKYLHSTGGI